MKLLPGRRREKAPEERPQTPGAPRAMQLQSRTERASTRVHSRVDRLRDALSPENVRKKTQELQRKIGLTRSGQVALFGAVLLWVFGRIIGGLPILLMAYGLATLVFVSYGLSPKRLKMEGDREGLFPRAQEGDRLDVEVHLVAKRSVSTFILEERVPERLGRPVKVPIAKLPSGDKVTHRYSVRCRRRGVYTIGPLVAVTSDPLGLTQREHEVAPEFELLVHPRVELVSDRPLTRHFEDPPIRPPVSRPAPSGYEFYGMREYRPGDDLRRIVWRASGRIGKVMVREAEQGITDQITILIDTNRGVHSRDGDHSDSFEAGVRVAASLAVRHLREGYEVRVEASGGQVFRPQRGPMAQLPLLDALTRLELDREPISKAVMRLITDPRRGAHNIVITPHLGQQEAAQLKLLLNRGVSVLVVALQWQEDQEESETLNTAAALGCQVAAVHPGQDLTTALYHDVGAGNR